MPAADESGQDELQLLALAVNDLLQVAEQALDDRGDAFKLGCLESRGQADAFRRTDSPSVRRGKGVKVEMSGEIGLPDGLCGGTLTACRDSAGSSSFRLS